MVFPVYGILPSTTAKPSAATTVIIIDYAKDITRHLVTVVVKFSSIANTRVSCPTFKAINGWFQSEVMNCQRQ